MINRANLSTALVVKENILSMEIRTMKRIFLLWLLLTTFSTGRSQFASSETVSNILDIPVLTGASRSSVIPANAGTLCFDRMLELISMDALGRELETKLYINSQLGYFGYTQNLIGSSFGSVSNPDADGFRFTLVSLEGNTYVYLTSISGGRMKKRVITHNSDFYHTANSGFSQPGSIRKTTETGTYGHRRSALLQTTVYTALGGEVKYHMVGNTYPEELSTGASTRYLVYGGVGFVLLNSKVYLSMAMLAGGRELVSVKVVRLEEHCFNSAAFEKMEDEIYEKGMTRIRKERDKLLRSTGISGPCASHDLTIKNYRMAMLDREEQLLEKSVLGNTLTDPVADAAMGGLVNTESQMQLMVYEQEKKICRAEYDLTRSSHPDELSRQNLDCYRRQLNQMLLNLAEMRTVETRFPGNQGKQMQERSRLLMNVPPCH